MMSECKQDLVFGGHKLMGGIEHQPVHPSQYNPQPFDFQVHIAEILADDEAHPFIIVDLPRDVEGYEHFVGRKGRQVVIGNLLYFDAIGQGHGGRQDPVALLDHIVLG